MLKAVFGSPFGKFNAVALLVVGATGGLAVTGDIPGLGTVPSYNVSASAAAGGPQRTGETLDFPTSVLEHRRVEPAPAVELVEEVVVVPAARTSTAGSPATVPAPKCVADVTEALNAIVGAIPSITAGEQGQALLAQANAVGVVANNCLAEAKQAGFPGIEGVAQLVNQAGAAIAQISAMPVVAAAPAQPGTQPNVVGGVVGGVGAVVGGTVNRVGDGLGLLGTGLNMLTSPLDK